MPFTSAVPESKRPTQVKNRAALNPIPAVPLVSARQTQSRLTTTQLIQPKLKIGASHDRYEQEADRVADQVMRMPDRQATGSSSPISGLPAGHSIQRRCDGCQQKLEEDSTLQAKTSSNATATVTPGLSSGIQSLRGNGQPMSDATRSYFEPRFGHQFNQVRIHTDSHAASLASSINARAFTLGQDVVFAGGQYQPDSREGRRLIAHELAHTIQQGKGSADTPRLSHVESDRIQKQDDDDEEQHRPPRRTSDWKFQLGFGPMRAPSPSGPEANFFAPTQQLPIPGFLLNRGVGLQYSDGRFDVGVFPNLGGSTDFYGTRDIPRLLRRGSSQPQAPLPQFPIPGQSTPPLIPSLTPPTLPGQVPTTDPSLTPQPSLRSLHERNIDHFVLNQSSLPSTAAAQLDSMVIWIRLARPAIVWVTGHTDVSGSEQHNQRLSEQRATTVRQALIDRGVDASVIEASGEGELNPLIPDATTQEQNAQNRRVTIEWFSVLPLESSLRLRSPWLNP